MLNWITNIFKRKKKIEYHGSPVDIRWPSPPPRPAPLHHSNYYAAKNNSLAHHTANYISPDLKPSYSGRSVQNNDDNNDVGNIVTGILIGEAIAGAFDSSPSFGDNGSFDSSSISAGGGDFGGGGSNGDW